MGKKTKIEWTDATWNPIRGCSRVSEGCRNCYAESVAARFSDPGQPYHGLAEFVTIGQGTAKERQEARWTGKVAFVKEHLQDPLRWQKPSRIFVNSMSDLFHAAVEEAWIWKIFGVMALSQRHTFQILTKRPARMLSILHGVDPAAAYSGISMLFDEVGAHPTCDMTRAWPLPNVWLGVSVEDQKTANERLPLLVQTPAAVRWVSYEPALGPIDWKEALPKQEWLCALNWIVAGGESGTNARPMAPDWARSTRQFCKDYQIPFFFKQWGEWGQRELVHVEKRHCIAVDGKPVFTRDLGACIQHSKDGNYLEHVGKKEAGHKLDGKEYREFPDNRCVNS